MIHQDNNIFRMNARFFRRLVEQILRMIDDVLVERGRLGDIDNERFVLASAGTPCLLPSARDIAGIAGHDARLQLANIDAEFECIGRNDALNRAVAQAFFDGAAFGWQITAPVAFNRFILQLIFGNFV